MRENQGMKKPPTPSKRTGMGRPKKNGHGRKDVSVGLAPVLQANLDAYVHHLRKKGARGAGRGDVLSEALMAFLPYRLWLQKRHP